MINCFTKWLHRNTVRIESFQNVKGKWQWKLKAWNGEDLDNASEVYSSEQACMDTVDMLRGRKII